MKTYDTSMLIKAHDISKGIVTEEFDNPLDNAKLDVQLSAELNNLVKYFIERDLLTPSYIKAAKSLAFHTDRMAKARLADTMMDAANGK